MAMTRGHAEDDLILYLVSFSSRLNDADTKDPLCVRTNTGVGDWAEKCSRESVLRSNQKRSFNLSIFAIRATANGNKVNVMRVPLQFESSSASIKWQNDNSDAFTST